MNTLLARGMISVCLATYNGGAFVTEQLHSVLSQLGPDDEVIVADDDSTDDTLAIVAAAGDDRVRVLTGGSLGVIRNFERALAASRGDIVFLCDQDDVWLPGKVKHSLTALTDHAMVVTDCKVVDAELNELHPSFFTLRGSGPGVLHNLWRNSYLGCCMAFRRPLLDIALPFPQGLPMHDMWLGTLAEFHGGVAFLSEPLLLYRRHDRNASDTAQRSTTRLATQLAWRYALATRVAARLFAIRVYRSRP